MGDPSTITFLPQISRKSVCLHVCGPISAACEVLARGLQASQIGLYPDCCLTWVDGITGGGHLSRLFTHAPSPPPIYGWNLGSPFVCVCVCVVREVLIYPYFLIKAAKTRYFMWLNVQIVITFTLCALVQKEYKSVDQVSRSEFYPSNLKKIRRLEIFLFVRLQAAAQALKQQHIVSKAQLSVSVVSPIRAMTSNISAVCSLSHRRPCCFSFCILWYHHIH